MSTVTFASAADQTEQRPRIVELARGIYGYISDFDPNCGFAVTDQGVLSIDTRATPAAARRMAEDLLQVTDKPVRYLALTHYHAVRVMGASAFPDATIVASRGTTDWINTRGPGDFKSEVERFPRLFKGVEEVPGLTQPHIVFDEQLELRLGGRVFELRHLGRGHTGGDTICWVPDCKVLFSGDLVENRCSVYAGDAFIGAWIGTLAKLRELPAEVLVPGRGAALIGRAAVLDAIDSTRDFLLSLRDGVGNAMQKGANLRGCYLAAQEAMQPRFGAWPLFGHVLPFDVARMHEELSGGEMPTEWTAERDAALWATIHQS